MREFADQKTWSADAVVRDLVSSLPALPPMIRYYDQLEQAVHTIHAPSHQTVFVVSINGSKRQLEFPPSRSNYATLWKHVFAYLLSEDLSVTTAYNYCRSGLEIPLDLQANVIKAGPIRVAQVWSQVRATGMSTGAIAALKALLSMMCRFRLRGWSDGYAAYLERALPYPHRDSYAGVRSGDVFLGPSQEAAIVRFLDDLTVKVTRSRGRTIRTSFLADAAMLACAYQFGMRPLQIAMLRKNHIRIWQDAQAGPPSVHLTFYMAKQRTTTARKPLTRKVKSEWSNLFCTLAERTTLDSPEAPGSLFLTRSASEVGQRISRLTRRIIGSREIGSTMDLRHTAAQRLVDAGANHEELAEFLGHSHVTTGLVYFDVSSSHAERVNRALGASNVYRHVARIARERFISPEELTQFKEDQQIAGVPHGIPIAGIGACTSGQPSCPYNPITSCYGCQKFLPVRDSALHASVLADMRRTVLLFESAGRASGSAPAFLQLQRTITEIQAVLESLGDLAS